MRIWDETSNATKQGERVDLHVGSIGFYILFPNGDEGVVLFIDIKVLYETVLQKVVKCPQAEC